MDTSQLNNLVKHHRLLTNDELDTVYRLSRDQWESHTENLVQMVQLEAPLSCMSYGDKNNEYICNGNHIVIEKIQLMSRDNTPQYVSALYWIKDGSNILTNIQRSDRVRSDRLEKLVKDKPEWADNIFVMAEGVAIKRFAV